MTGDLTSWLVGLLRYELVDLNAALFETWAFEGAPLTYLVVLVAVVVLVQTRLVIAR
mgnify:CR=1 FL=1